MYEDDYEDMNDNCDNFDCEHNVCGTCCSIDGIGSCEEGGEW